MSAEPPDQRDTSVAVRLKEQVLAEQLALKDRALDVAAEGITIADARLPARPLIYANDGFERLTGYSVGEVLGRNCRFLQGPESDPTAVAEIRAAIAEQRECIVEILNLPARRQLVLEPALGHPRSRRFRRSHPLHRYPVGCVGASRGLSRGVVRVAEAE